MAISVTEAIKPTTDVLQTYDINPTDVLAEDNITQTVTAPAVAPDDLLGIRKEVYSEYGVDESSEAYKTSKKAYQDALNKYNTEQLELGNRAVSMSKITGIRNQHTMANQNYLNNLLSAQELALEDYTSKKANANEIFAIREAQVAEKKALMLQFPDAGIKWGDSTDKIAKRLSEYQEEQEKKAEKNAYKEALRSMGMSTKGSRRELEERLRKINEDAYRQAKRTSDLQLEQLEISLAKARESLNQTETSAASFYGDNTTVGSSGPMSSSTPAFDFSFYGL